MAKLFYFDKVINYGEGNNFIFRTDKYREVLVITSFEDGIAVAVPMVGDNIYSFSELIAACLNEDSNFRSELCRAFKKDNKTVLNKIRFNFNDAEIIVTKEDASGDKIYNMWKNEMNKINEKHQMELEEYMKTEEYRIKRAKELKAKIRKDLVKQNVLKVDKSTEFEFKNDEAKKKWKELIQINSKDEYSLCVMTYARRWAKYRQHLMSKHNKTVEQIASEASFKSDIEGITGFMYGVSVSILSRCWKYGEELRIWHNKQWGNDENIDGVVNPAIINIEIIN